MIFFWIVLAALLLFFIVSIAVAWMMYSALLIRSDTLHTSEASPYQAELAMVKRWEAEHLACRKRLVLAASGATLIGYFFEYPSSRRAVLCVHGYTSEHTERLALAPVYYGRGYNILAVDCRAHGESSGIHRTMGYWDQEDVVLWARYLTDVLGMEEIVLDGVSMGAATVLAASAHPLLPSSVRAVVADCGYTSAHDIFAYQMKKMYHLPAFPVLPIAEWFCRHIGHFSVRENSPIERTAASRVPTLFIHGTRDDFVPYSMVDELYNACQAPKAIARIPGAVHAVSHFACPELYQKAVCDFLDQYCEEVR